MNPLWSALAADLADREAAHLKRRLTSVPSGCLDLASNDYLGLTHHPEVIAAVAEAAEVYGAGGRASRLVSGDCDLHRELEAALADLKRAEGALVFPTGFAANLGVIGALCGADSFIACHKRNHASLIDSCRLAAANGARVRYYEPTEKLERLLSRTTASRRFIVTDAVFSMDGDLAPLPDILALAERFDATILLDDAHGTGTLGATGAGATEHWEIRSDRIVHVGTLSKALASQGGFVAGPRVLIEYLVNSARSFIYTTALNPPAAAAALASLRILKREPERVRSLGETRDELAELIGGMGLEIWWHASPILPVIAGESQLAVDWSHKLAANGVWCPAIRPPTVSAGTARLRLTARSGWGDLEVAKVARSFRALL